MVPRRALPLIHPYSRTQRVAAASQGVSSPIGRNPGFSVLLKEISARGQLESGIRTADPSDCLMTRPALSISHGGPKALSGWSEGWSETAQRPISATLFTPGCNAKVVDKEYSTNYTVITRKIQVSLCTNKQEQMCIGQTKKSDGSPGESVPWHSSASLRLYYTTRGS